MFVVSSGMQQVINDGSTYYDVVVASGGEQLVEQGYTSNTLVESDGVQVVESVSPYGVPSVVHATEVQSGGLLVLNAGAEADQPTVDSGGYLLAFDGSYVQGATLDAGAVAISGGIVSFSPQAGVVVSQEAVDGLMVDSGGFAYVLNDGLGANVSVSSSSELGVYSGGEVSGASVARFGILAVGKGGQLRGAIVSGEVSVAGPDDPYDMSADGYASGVTVASTGEYFVRGVGSGAVVAGDEDVEAGGMSYGSQIVSGGVQTIDAGLSYGNDVVFPAGVASAAVVCSGGEEIAEGGSTVSAVVQSGGEIRLDDSGSLLDAQVELGGRILIGSTVFRYDALNATIAFDRATDRLTISEFTTSNYTLQLAGDYSDLAFTSAVVDDGLLLTAAAAACYAEGTVIAMPGGGRAVELVAIGDMVITAFGQHRPIRWIGRRSYGGRFLCANPGVQPVRFCTGSLGQGLPRRDLLVSPDHAMFLEGVLIPAKALVNGTTIVQERGLDRVNYYHLELDQHDVILAERAPSETFVDDGSRGQFQNAQEYAALYPDVSAPAYYARRVDSGFELEAVRRRLAATAEAGAIAAA